VQVDPIKPMLKAPGTKRLKLKHDKTLSSFAFNFNLRRYSKGLVVASASGRVTWAGAYTRPLLISTWAVSDTKYTLNTP
jgi:hypothetical protein